jgi:hypothetical protein
MSAERVYRADTTATALTLNGEVAHGYRVWCETVKNWTKRAHVCAVFFTPTAAVLHAKQLNERVDGVEHPVITMQTPMPTHPRLRPILEPVDDGRINNHGHGPFKEAGRQDRCSVCGEKGHKKPTCSLIRNGPSGDDHGPDGTEGNRCSRCDYLGHNIRTCSALFNRAGDLCETPARVSE